MIEALPHLASIALGFFAKLMAIKSEDAKNREQLMLNALAVQSGAYVEARSYDTPSAKFNRRLLIWFIMVAVMVSVMGYAVLGVPVYVEQVIQEPSYLFGLIGGGERVEWVKIEGIPTFQEIFRWGTMIFEMLFGAQLARRS